MVSRFVLISLVVCVCYRFANAGYDGFSNTLPVGGYNNGGYGGAPYDNGAVYNNNGGYGSGGYGNGGYTNGGYPAGGAYPSGGYNTGYDGGFGGPSQSFQNSGYNMFDNKLSSAAGNAAGAGQASALEGTAQSINTANHQAGRGMTASNALSANTAQGLGVQVCFTPHSLLPEELSSYHSDRTNVLCCGYVAGKWSCSSGWSD